MFIHCSERKWHSKCDIQLKQNNALQFKISNTIWDHWESYLSLSHYIPQFNVAIFSYQYFFDPVSSCSLYLLRRLPRNTTNTPTILGEYFCLNLKPLGFKVLLSTLKCMAYFLLIRPCDVHIVNIIGWHSNELLINEYFIHIFERIQNRFANTWIAMMKLLKKCQNDISFFSQW